VRCYSASVLSRLCTCWSSEVELQGLEALHDFAVFHAKALTHGSMCSASLLTYNAVYYGYL
jgi:hypothetical protein